MADREWVSARRRNRHAGARALPGTGSGETAFAWLPTSLKLRWTGWRAGSAAAGIGFMGLSMRHFGERRGFKKKWLDLA